MAGERRFRFGAQLSFAGSHEAWAAETRREELGYSALCVPDHFDGVVGGECHEAMAPVVGRLAGT